MTRQLPPPRPDRNAPPTWQGKSSGVVFFALALASTLFLLVYVVVHQAAS